MCQLVRDGIDVDCCKACGQIKALISSETSGPFMCVCVCSSQGRRAWTHRQTDSRATTAATVLDSRLLLAWSMRSVKPLSASVPSWLRWTCRVSRLQMELRSSESKQLSRKSSWVTWLKASRLSLFTERSPFSLQSQGTKWKQYYNICDCNIRRLTLSITLRQFSLQW